MSTAILRGDRGGGLRMNVEDHVVHLTVQCGDGPLATVAINREVLVYAIAHTCVPTGDARTPA